VKKTLIGMAVVFIVLAIYVFVEPYWLGVKTYEITNPEVPSNFNSTKIVFLSDIHHGPYFSISRVKRLVERVNRLNPDIIILGGDYVHRNQQYIVPVFNELKGLKAPLGIYGVLGNHDHWENAALTREQMKESRIRELDNAAFWITKGEQRIKIGGVGDYMEDVQNIIPTIGDAVKEDFVIVVSHNPDYAEEIMTDKVDLMLSGHTHGGQITFFGLWAPVLPSQFGQKYRTGLIDSGTMKVIVSNGIGVITPPARFFAPPQIVSVILKKN
jgi:uncharacterized protein